MIYSTRLFFSSLSLVLTILLSLGHSALKRTVCRKNSRSNQGNNGFNYFVLGRMIPPYTTLVFEKELVELVKGELKWTREKSPGCWTVDSTYWMDTVTIHYKITAAGSEAVFSNIG